MAGTDVAAATPVEIEKIESVDELVAIIRAEHDLALAAAQTTIEHAVKAGEALLKIRLLLIPDGTWTPWLEGEFPGQRSTAYGYMRLAQYKSLIPPGAGITKSEAMLKNLPAIGEGRNGRGRGRIDDIRKEEARRWRAETPPVPYKQIAKRLGCSVGSVYNWFGGQKTREKQARRALRASEEAKKNKRLAGRNQTALAEAYSMVEKMRDVLGQARREATTDDAKLALKRAEEYHHVSRDAVVEALQADAV